MANIQYIIIFLIFFTFQMLCGEGRYIKYLTGVENLEIRHIKGPSLRSIRRLSTLTDKSNHDEKSATPKTVSPEFFETTLPKEKLPSSKPNHKSHRNDHEVGSFWADINQSSCLGVNCPEDFKPTAPGKSPGAGHAYVTSSEDVSSNQPTKNPKKIGVNLEANVDDFRETTPGQSPGAGHAKRAGSATHTPAGVEEDFPPTPISVFSESEMISTDDFKPTNPGSSPGAGHPETRKFDVNCLKIKCTDDFRPTTPGDSPGAGHPIKSNSNSITSKQDMQSSETQSQGGLDDYRPTKPGQSPGAGHAVLNKQEPNS